MAWAFCHYEKMVMITNVTRCLCSAVSLKSTCSEQHTWSETPDSLCCSRSRRHTAQRWGRHSLSWRQGMPCHRRIPATSSAGLMAPCYLDTVGHDANPLGKKKKDTKGSKYKYFFLKRAKMQKKKRWWHWASDSRWGGESLICVSGWTDELWIGMVHSIIFQLDHMIMVGRLAFVSDVAEWRARFHGAKFAMSK